MKRTLKKEKGIGTVEMVTCLFLIIVVCLFGMMIFKNKEIKMARNFLEDGITLSGLAGALFDDEHLLEEKEMIIEKGLTYNAFMESLLVNLQLNDDMTSKDNLYYTKITVNRYITYDVLDGKTIETIYESDTVYEVNEYAGTTTSPDGQEVLKTSIYVEIGVYLNGFLGAEEEYRTVSKLIGLRGIE